MGFRERPEYDAWRDAVAKLFGRKCIACGHDGNIHMHHIQPVEDFPELAFDPKNGVPLCGNCHVNVKGREIEFVEKFRDLQQRFLGVSQAMSPALDEFRRAAEADLSNEDAVMAFLMRVREPQQASDFYLKYEKHLNHTPKIILAVACLGCLCVDGRHADGVKFADNAIELVKQEGTTANHHVDLIAHWRLESLAALGKNTEIRPYLEGLLHDFPEIAHLHHKLSWAIAKEAGEITEGMRSDRCLTHALRAVELCSGVSPNLSVYVSVYLGWASLVCVWNARLKDALGFAKKEFEIARNDSEKLTAIRNEARVFEHGNLYDDAIVTYRKALEIDSENAQVMAKIADCNYKLNRIRAAGEMATRSLFYDPNNELATDILSKCRRA